MADQQRAAEVERLKRAFLEHREADAKLKALRQKVKDSQREFQKTEDDLRALQSVGQIIGEVLRELSADKYIVKASSGPRYVVGRRRKVDRAALKVGTRGTYKAKSARPEAPRGLFLPPRLLRYQ